MNTRLTVQPNFRTKSTKVKLTGNVRRKAWLAVFAASALVWIAVVLLIWRMWG